MLYAPILKTFFLSDDLWLIRNLNQSGFFSTWGDGFFRPVSMLFFTLDFNLWKFNPYGFHLTNILFHSINVVLLYQLYLRLIKNSQTSQKKYFLAPLVAASLFLIQANHSEAVTWISGRSDLIATTFILLSLLAQQSFFRCPNYFRLGWFTLFVLVSLLSKEIAMVVPGYCSIMSIWWLTRGSFSKKRIMTAIYPVILSLGILGIYLLMRHHMLGKWLGGYGAHYHLDFFSSNIVSSLASLIWRSFFPPLPPTFIQWLLTPAGGILLLVILSIAVIIAIYRFLKKDTSLALIFAAWVGFFLLSLLPIAVMKISLHTVENERYIYLPSAFATAGLLFFLDRFLANQRFLFMSIIIVLILSHGALLLTNHPTWQVAGQLVSRVIKQIQPGTKPNLIILNLPDNFRGVYCFRTLYPPTLLYFHLYFSKSQAQKKYRILSSKNHEPNSYTKFQDTPTQKNINQERQILFQQFRSLLETKTGQKWQAITETIEILKSSPELLIHQKLAQTIHEATNLKNTETLLLLHPLFEKSQQSPTLKHWQWLLKQFQILQQTSFYTSLKRLEHRYKALAKVEEISKKQHRHTILTVAYHDYLSPSDTISITQTGAALTIGLKNNQASFLHFSGNKNITLFQHSPQSIQVKFSNALLKKSDIFYFSQGNLIPWHQDNP